MNEQMRKKENEQLTMKTNLHGRTDKQAERQTDRHLVVLTLTIRLDACKGKKQKLTLKSGKLDIWK